MTSADWFGAWESEMHSMGCPMIDTCGGVLKRFCRDGLAGYPSNGLHYARALVEEFVNHAGCPRLTEAYERGNLAQFVECARAHVPPGYLCL